MKLSIKNLTKIYHSETEGSLALNDVSIDFPETGFVVITGESGSGKTTLLNVLSGFTSYEEGDYFIDGVDFLSLSSDELQTLRKNDIGFVFQDYHLIESHTVLDNLIESLAAIGVEYKEAKEKSLSILDLFGLADKATDKVRNLSGGQKQKIAIARAMLKEPAVILCDEPTANLDYKSGIKIFEILKYYSKNHLVIITTHNYEDAKDYATESIRIYHGKLTVHEELVPQDGTTTKKEDKKTRFLPIFFTNIKNHIPKTILKISFSSIFLAIIILVISLFAANIDDASTKVLSRTVFNNINQNELLVMHRDGAVLTEQDLLQLDNSHIVHHQEYGHATEMNYYYRENIDYQYNVVIDGYSDEPGSIIEYTKLVFQPIQDTLYLKDYVSFVNENNIVEGTLPKNYNEVVANSNYKVGDTIKVYFGDRVIQGYNYIELDFVVSGIYNNKDDNLYFSTELLEAMDYLETYGTITSPFKFLVTYTKNGGKINDSISLYPIYNPSLADDQVVVSKMLVDSKPAIFEETIIETSARSEVTNEKIAVSFDASTKATSDKINAPYIYVGKAVYDLFIKNYSSSTGRVYVDTYSYMNDVVSYLNGLNYDSLSPYRACSTTYDTGKQTQRTIVLIVSLVLVFLVSFVYYIFGYLFEKGNLSSDETLYLIGASSNSLRKSSSLAIGLTYLLSLGLSIAIYYIVTSSIQIPFIQNVNTYIRYYHFFIVAGIALVLSLFIWWKYIRQISKFKRGGND